MALSLATRATPAASGIALSARLSGDPRPTRLLTRPVARRMPSVSGFSSVRGVALPGVSEVKSIRMASHVGNVKLAALGDGTVELLGSPSDLSQHAFTPLYDVADGLESPIQGFYLFTLLSVLVIGAFLVVRQVLVRNELEETIKVLGERKRRGEATAEDYFELGVVLVRKKLYTQATQNLRSAQKMWDGEPEELAQVHNAIGFSFFNMGKYDDAIKEYKKAVELQPGYVTAWNNLGDAFEAQKKYKEAVDCYTEVLSYAPDNKVAKSRKEFLDTKISRRGA